MGSTVGGLPYPDGTSKVVDGDDAIKALAQAVDGGTAFSVVAAANYTVFAQQCFRRGSSATISIRLDRTTGTVVEGDVFANFPGGTRPTSNILFPVLVFNGAFRPAAAQLLTNGTIQVFLAGLTGVTLVAAALTYQVSLP